MKTGIIQQSLSGFYDVIADEKIYRTRARGNFRQRKVKPVVGDHVEFSAENQQEGYLLNILPAAISWCGHLLLMLIWQLS